ncbi:MAG TPA: toxin [Galbitalea sp.]
MDPTEAQRVAEHPVYVAYLDEDSPARQLRLGFDSSGRLIETVVLQFDSGNELLIHAMKARPEYYDLL